MIVHFEGVRKALKAERSKETASLELLEGLQPCQPFDLVKLLASGTVR